MQRMKISYDTGTRRRANPAYTRIIRKGKHSGRIARKQGILPLMMDDKTFKRLIYIRYADDFIIGIDSSKESAYEVYENVKKFLMEVLKFDIKNNSKILHFRTERSMFLGVELKGNQLSLVPTIKYLGRKARSSLRPLIIMPMEKIRMKLVKYKFVKKKGKMYKPTRCGRLIHHDLHQILSYYNAIYRGLCGYYHICTNRALLGNIHYFLKYSCALTIASKMKLKTKHKVFQKYGGDLSITLGGRTQKFVETDY
jgi:hypothetical protein